ncbi:NAD-dependent epimerase/dehydratase family protein [Bacteroidota bacterium]
MSEINIVFGTGPLGCAVAEELLARRQSVKLVGKSGDGDIPEGATFVKADVTDPELTREVCKNVRTVFHCAMPPYTQWPELFPAITYGIMKGAISAEANLVYGDNLYMYGQVNGPIKEDHPYNAKGPKGKTRGEMADKLIKAHNDGKVKVAIGRASDFFGPKVLNSILGERVFIPALKGTTINLLGRIDQPHTFTYIKDFAKGLVTLSENEIAFGAVWHIPSAETITIQKFLHRVISEVETFPSVKTAPKFVVNVMALFNPFIRELKEVLPYHELPYVVDHSKYERTFGNHSTPHETAIKETVEWYKAKYNH